MSMCGVSSNDKVELNIISTKREVNIREIPKLSNGTCACLAVHLFYVPSPLITSERLYAYKNLMNELEEEKRVAPSKLNAVIRCVLSVGILAAGILGVMATSATSSGLAIGISLISSIAYGILAICNAEFSKINFFMQNNDNALGFVVALLTGPLIPLDEIFFNHIDQLQKTISETKKNIEKDFDRAVNFVESAQNRIASDVRALGGEVTQAQKDEFNNFRKYYSQFIKA